MQHRLLFHDLIHKAGLWSSLVTGTKKNGQKTTKIAVCNYTHQLSLNPKTFFET